VIAFRPQGSRRLQDSCAQDPIREHPALRAGFDQVPPPNIRRPQPTSRREAKRLAGPSSNRSAVAGTRNLVKPFEKKTGGVCAFAENNTQNSGRKSADLALRIAACQPWNRNSRSAPPPPAFGNNKAGEGPVNSSRPDAFAVKGGLGHE